MDDGDDDEGDEDSSIVDMICSKMHSNLGACMCRFASLSIKVQMEF